jgi:hypothetical protein
MRGKGELQSPTPVPSPPLGGDQQEPNCEQTRRGSYRAVAKSPVVSHGGLLKSPAALAREIPLNAAALFGDTADLTAAQPLNRWCPWTKAMPLSITAYLPDVSVKR